MKLLTVLFLLLLGGILANSQLSLYYAARGLDLWFQKMIPALLPFMILSGIMVRMKLTDKVSMIIYPVIRPLYKVRKNVCYAMLMGFLCGFPMGARVTDDLCSRRMISKREAEYLLAFCNNIGPVYFCSFALPLLERKLVFPYLFGMYGIPLLYGLFLRYTFYRDIPAAESSVSEGKKKLPGKNSGKAALVCCENTPAKVSYAEKLLEETDHAVHSSVQNILSLGGYMILFNLLNLIPHMLTGNPPALIAPLLEITGGLTMLADSMPEKAFVLWKDFVPWSTFVPWNVFVPLYSLLALSFGGLSCIAQTYSSIAESGLSIRKYVLHKCILTFINALFYFSWFLIQPSSFLC